MEEKELSMKKAISRYFKSIHRSSAKKELGRDFFAVQNLCVAYKFLIHKKLVRICLSEPTPKIPSLTTQQNCNVASPAQKE